MKFYWTLVSMFVAAIATGCGEQPAENSLNPEATAPAGAEVGLEATTPEPAAATRSRNDNSAIRPTEASRPATARPAATAPSRPAFRELTVPAGTSLPLELVAAVSSETAQVETPVRARLRQPLSVDGSDVLPAGAILHGNVTAVERPGRVRGRAQLAFRFTEVEFDGGREDLRTNVLSFEGEETKGEDATKIGAGAVGGAIIGGILGGGDGAAKGAAIGGAAGTGAVLATRGRDVTLAAGADLSASLAQPLTVRVAN